MESLKIIPKNQHRKNKSLIFKYCDLSFYKKRENPEKNDKIDYDTTSLKSKNTQSVSTGPEEKVENTYKRSFSKKLISLSLLLNRLSKRKKECLIELNLRRRRKGSTPEKNAIQVININQQKNINSVIINKNDSIKNINKNINPNNNNNNKNGKIYEEDSSMNNEMTQANKYKLKSLPPKLYELSYNKYNLSGNSNAVNRDNKFMPKIPNVFINHLMIQESLNINNSNNLLLSATNRIKGKKLTILYYHPKKSVL
jgi:hypothetical protein